LEIRVLRFITFYKKGGPLKRFEPQINSVKFESKYLISRYP